MERALNIFHYCSYLFFNKLQLFNNKINLVLLLYKLPYFRKKHKKNNYDPVKVHNEVWMNKENGFNVLIADIVLGVTIIAIFMGLFFIITRVLNITHNMPKPYVLIFVAIGLYISNLYVFKKDKYLDYYQEFEHWTKKQRRKYMLFSFLTIIGTIVFFFASFMVSF